MNERSPLMRLLNAPLIVSVVLLTVYGSIIVNSAVSGMEYGPAMFKRHLFGIVVGLVPLAFAWAFDYRKLHGWVGPLLVFDVLLIISPMIPGLGAEAKGAQLWLEIAGVRLMQPSEPAKLVFIVMLAGVIAGFKGRIESAKDVGQVALIAGIPTALVVAVGDLGTALVFVSVTLGMLLIGGLRVRWFAIFAVIAVLLVAGIFRLDAALDTPDNDRLIKKYQRDRLTVFVDPSADPTGAGYNLAQSKIAIGSGELTGKGLRSGTQGNLNFLPERHTDFIFSVLGEELGFAGSVALLALYLVLLVGSLEISASSRDLFGASIVAGIISMWTFQILENVGMTIGLMPITGIPLPFMSFGSSFMVTNMMATGMLLSVWTRRHSR